MNTTEAVSYLGQAAWLLLDIKAYLTKRVELDDPQAFALLLQCDAYGTEVYSWLQTQNQTTPSPPTTPSSAPSAVTAGVSWKPMNPTADSSTSTTPATVTPLPPTGSFRALSSVSSAGTPKEKWVGFF